MKRKFTTVDHVAFLVARGCNKHPLVYESFHEQLDILSRQGKISFTPFTIYEKFHRRMTNVA